MPRGCDSRSVPPPDSHLRMPAPSHGELLEGRILPAVHPGQEGPHESLEDEDKDERYGHLLPGEAVLAPGLHSHPPRPRPEKAAHALHQVVPQLRVVPVEQGARRQDVLVHQAGAQGVAEVKRGEDDDGRGDELCRPGEVQLLEAQRPGRGGKQQARAQERDDRQQADPCHGREAVADGGVGHLEGDAAEEDGPNGQACGPGLPTVGLLEDHREDHLDGRDPEGPQRGHAQAAANDQPALVVLAELSSCRHGCLSNALVLGVGLHAVVAVLQARVQPGHGQERPQGRHDLCLADQLKVRGAAAAGVELLHRHRENRSQADGQHAREDPAGGVHAPDCHWRDVDHAPDVELLAAAGAEAADEARGNQHVREELRPPWGEVGLPPPRRLRGDPGVHERPQELREKPREERALRGPPPEIGSAPH
mmetsp:Transcript_90900/g.283192  ORF Transcript_90900/g.283192 Transcript_90900/m.283192 type:complete len:422 (+) Transcript_90900:194-1459(+)